MRTSLLTCFFLEGKDYFDTPFELVYTRNIVDPQWGVKLTGKSKGTTIGLFSYEYRPGTVFYLGVDDNREKDIQGFFQGTSRYYFIKFSYWWRV